MRERDELLIDGGALDIAFVDVNLGNVVVLELLERVQPAPVAGAG